MNEFDRIELLAKRLGFRSVRSFAIEVGITPQIFYDIKSGKCKMSRNIVYQIKEKYKNVNSQWLTGGVGAPFEGEAVSSTPDEVESLKQIINTQKEFIESLKEQVSILKEMVKSNSREIQDYGIQKNA